ncbi:hypothetical protein FRB90_011625 [Tulasnella sp. 427]|nr:hypothetical protein FRB90_011625 [Tulasnella sp. 427]
MSILEGLVEDTSDRIVWLVFPWAEHGNLFAFVTSRDWEIPERLSLIFDVAKGVEFLHGQSPPICHADLKSLNVLVNAECRAVITDFGSARRIRQTDSLGVNGGAPAPLHNFATEGEDAIGDVQLTATGDGVTLTAGKYTLRWAAPERLNEDRESLACDIWSLGWIAYEVMFGRVPFYDVKSEAVVIWRVMQGDLPCLLDDARMVLVGYLCILMMHCWILDPDSRPNAVDCVVGLGQMPMIVPMPNVGASQQEAELREAEIKMKLGRMYYDECDYRNAKDCYTRATAVFSSHGRMERQAAGVEALSNVHRRCGEYVKSAKLFSEALQIYLDVGDRGLAEVRRMRDEYDEAVKHYSEVLQISIDIGDRNGKVVALSGLAEAYHKQNNHEEAVRLYSEALQIHNDIGDQRGKALTLVGLGGVHRTRDLLDDVTEKYSEALQIFTDIGDKDGISTISKALAQIQLLRSDDPSSRSNS